VTAEDDQHLIEAVDELGKQLRRSIGESLRAVRAAPPLARVTTASLPALRALMAAYRAEHAGNRRRAITLLEEALALDTAFAMAWNFLGTLHYNGNRYRQASEAYRRAYGHRDRLTEGERLRVVAHYHRDRGEEVQAEAAYRQLIELEPYSASPWINLAEIKLTTRQLSQAESLSLRAIELDPQAIVGYWNAVEAQVAQRRFEAADSVLALMTARLPDHPWLRSLQSRVTVARRDFDAAQAYFDSLWVAGPTQDSAVVRLSLCGLKLYRGRLREWRQCGYVSPAAALWELRYSGDTARVSRMVDSLLASESRPYPGLVTVLAEMGRIREAHQVLGEWRGALGPDDPGYRTRVGRAAGSIALAEGRPDSAVTAFLAWNRAGYVGATHIFNRGLAEAANAHDQAGRPDSAIALYEHALGIPSITGASYEAIWYPHALRRLGELHESLGHREQAVEYYGKFIELWKDADPELQEQVEATRAALVRLMGEPPR
jgi:tetratricopeptide (TPR) repeat protein